MSYILGLSGAVFHDAAAALFEVNDHNELVLVAAAEEERFIRDKHAKGCLPEQAIRFCMAEANLKPNDISFIAYPYSEISLASPARWHYAKRYWYSPDRSIDALFNGNRRYRRNINKIKALYKILGFNAERTKVVPIEHHYAHASSAYHLSDFGELPGKTAILSLDGKGEYASTFLAYGEQGEIHKLKEFYDPDSLGGLYGAMTQYLGFEMLDGEFKVMGMAPYGDPLKYDLSRLISYQNKSYRVNTRYLNTVGPRRYQNHRGQKFYFSQALVDWLGPMREGDQIDEPYIHYAAAVQKLLEDTVQRLIDDYLAEYLAETGRLCLAGGVGLNVKLNQKLLARPDVNTLFVQPAANDAGTALGAATYLASQLKQRVRPQRHAYLGPSFTNEDCIQACEQHPEKPKWQRLDDAPAKGAELLAQGHPLAWFQGRMEFGPRALGNRSILGNPASEGVADRINAQIKYRERWRPFCPSMLDRVAAEILQTDHPAPYMTITFEVAKAWKHRIPEVVHEDGTARAQIVSADTNPRYYALIEALEQRTGQGVVLNTSLNRRGEPMVCSPTDALNMFFGCDLQYLIMEDILITKDSGIEVKDEAILEH